MPSLALPETDLGKPFAGELNAFAETYRWALEARIDDLTHWARAVGRLPLTSVGSGGSFTSAVYSTFLHTLFTGRLAKAIAPLEFVNSPLYLEGLGVLLLTAGGSNPDILSCAEHVRSARSVHLGTVCARKGSPLSEAVAGVAGGCLSEFELPTGKDGFLATNSLVATCMLLSRAYAAAWNTQLSVPASLGALLHPRSDKPDFRSDLAALCAPLWERQTTVVLHGHTTQAAAVDLESKFTEAAIGHVQIADYRSFAHGRHHWLARHGKTSGVLAFITPDDRRLAERTLRLIPQDSPVARLDFEHPPMSAALGAIVVGMHIVGLAGEARGIDPGRPTVAAFGRRLYHLGGLSETEPPAKDMTDVEVAAIERKAGVGVTSLAARGELSAWRVAHVGFRQRLREATFGAVVFDYDGTLCDTTERFSGPRAAVAQTIGELLKGGILVGIATGRGRSVRQDLRRLFPKRSHWKHVLIGYHNGGEIGWLADDTQPPDTTELDESLRPLEAALRSQSPFDGVARVEAKLRQITLELTRECDADRVWAQASRLTRRWHDLGVSLVRSSHSIDALALGVSKRLLVERVREELRRGERAGDVLCIGDKGRWPGNDFALLEEPHSLSVDETSEDRTSCWNLAPPGVRCVEATLFYLGLLSAADGRLSVRL